MPTSINKYQNIVSKWSQNPWEIGPRTQQKTMLKNRATKIQKNSEDDLKIGPKEWLYIKGFASGGAFGGSNRFCDQKVGPNAPQMRSRIEKWNENDLKELSEFENELQKLTLFGAKGKWTPKVDPFRSQARRTARSAYNEPID